MEIVLYGVPVSTFVAKVRIALDLKGMTYREAPPPGGYGSPEYRAIVPAGSVPGLSVDGRAFHGSNALIELIDELRPEPPLFPADPFARARARGLLDFHDNRVEAAARALFPLVKRDWRTEPEAVEAGLAAVEAVLERLVPLLPAPGARPSIADMAFPVTLQMAEMMAAAFGRPLAAPAVLGQWRADATAPEAVARSLAIAGTAMEAWLAGFRR